MYTEESIPYPENFYSLTKLLGEFEVNRLSNATIIRTNFVPRKPWPYEKKHLPIDLEHICFADQVAIGINDIIKEKITGIIHVVGDKKNICF